MANRVKNSVARHSRFKSLRDYFETRRKDASVPNEYSDYGGFEVTDMLEPAIIDAGTDMELFVRAAYCNDDAAGEFALSLMKKVLEAQSRVKRGESQLASRGLAISPFLMGSILSVLVARYAARGRLLPSDVTVLLLYHLDGYAQAARDYSDSARNRRTAVRTATQMALNGQNPTYRKIAKAMGIAPATLTRWYPSEELIKLAEKYAFEMVERRSKRQGV